MSLNNNTSPLLTGEGLSTHNTSVAIKKIPSITIETTDYEHIAKMNNHSVVHVFLSFEQNNRRKSIPSPETYNSYIIRRYPNRLIVCLVKEAAEIFRVVFVPANGY